MEKKIYVASSWRNPTQQIVVARLREAGLEVYDFRNPHQTRERSNGFKGVGFHWSDIDPAWKAWTPNQFRAALKTQTAIDGFHSDSDALEWCDRCVMVPGETAGRSMHLEAGFAIGRGKPTAIYIENQCEPELMYSWATICVTLAEVVEFATSFWV